jgi:hypothetical protein
VLATIGFFLCERRFFCFGKEIGGLKVVDVCEQVVGEECSQL